MQYIIPDYYKEFRCTASECEDTCCAGWQIVIDEKSLKKYGKIKGPFRKRVHKSINWIESTFRQDKERRCAFLNDQNLCDLYIEEGEGCLCDTCRRYPRHIEEFEDVREVTLSVSCPEVAKILLSKEEPVQYYVYENEKVEEYEDFDLFLYSLLFEARNEMLHILQNRELSIHTRMGLVIGMAHDLQRRVDAQEIFQGYEVICRYKKEEAAAYVEKNWKGLGDPREQFRMLSKLEILRPEWQSLLMETEAILYANGEEAYHKINQEWEDWKKEQGGRIEIQIEQLMVYYLFTYFCGAVYDGDLYAKARMTLLCAFLNEEIWKARFVKNEGTLEQDEREELVYRFSRELEHSDENLIRMENMQKKV